MSEFEFRQFIGVDIAPDLLAGVPADEGRPFLVPVVDEVMCDVTLGGALELDVVDYLGFGRDVGEEVVQVGGWGVDGGGGLKGGGGLAGFGGGVVCLGDGGQFSQLVLVPETAAGHVAVLGQR